MLPLLHGLRLHFHGLRFCALRSVPSELQLNTDTRTARTQIHSIVLGAFPRTFLEQHPLITLPVPACFTTHSPPSATGMRLHLPGRPPVALPEFRGSFPLFLHCPRTAAPFWLLRQAPYRAPRTKRKTKTNGPAKCLSSSLFGFSFSLCG